MKTLLYILTIVFPFTFLHNAKSQQIYEEKLKYSYFYSLAEQSEFFETESGRIDAKWLSFEKIGIPYQTAIRDYLFAKMDSLQISRTNPLTIAIMVDSSGKGIYCHILAYKQLTEFDKLEQLFRYALLWQKPFILSNSVYFSAT